MEKLCALLVGVWLLCGVAAAFLLVDQRPLTTSDFALGPLSLAEAVR